MREELKVIASVRGYTDKYITRDDVIQEYRHQLEAIAHIPECYNQTDIVQHIANKLLDDISYDIDGMEVDEIKWWDEDELIDFIDECLSSMGEYEEAPDGQLVLFDPTPYEKSLYEINLEEYNRLAELRKQTERVKKSLDKS